MIVIHTTRRTHKRFPSKNKTKTRATQFIHGSTKPNLITTPYADFSPTPISRM